MQMTANYGLKKPEGNDTVDIDVINGNMDAIDTKLKNNADSIGTLQGTVNSHLADTMKHIGYAVTTSSGNAYSAVIPNLTVLTDGLQVRVKFNSASSGATTLNINGLGAKSIVDYFGNAVTNIRQNLIANLCYEATSGNFILQGKGGGGNATSSDLLSGKTATVDGGQITGSMANYSGQNINTYASNAITKVIIDPVWANGGQIEHVINSRNTTISGYFDNTTKITLDVLGLRPENIKAGVSVGDETSPANNMIGTFTADATALTSDKIVSGYSAYANGNKINGSAILGKKYYSNTLTLPTQYNKAFNVYPSGTYAPLYVSINKSIFGFTPSVVILTDGSTHSGIYYANGLIVPSGSWVATCAGALYNSFSVDTGAQLDIPLGEENTTKPVHIIAWE